MTIAIDIDEVLADTLNSYIKYYNNTYNTSLKREQFFTYSCWWKVLQVEFDEGVVRFNDFVNKGYLGNLPAVKGAQEAVAKLQKNHDLVIVTSRMGELKKITRKWLDENFSGCFLKVYHTESIYDKDAITKSEACLQSKADILIEDDFNFTVGCANNDIKVLLFDNPWNHDVKLLPKMVRVYGWDDILQEVRNKGL